MKAFKGFDKDMKCRGFQFEEGKTYHEEKAELCHSGFHACEVPLDVFGYYAPGDRSIYREVELEDMTEERESDSKRCGKTIKIGAALDVAGICKAHFEYVKSHCTNENNAEPGNPATAGNYGAATAGDSGAATAGDSGAATSRGRSSVGRNGVAVARGNGIRVRGGIGAVLVAVVEQDNNFEIKEWLSGVVDGEALKPDVWYTVQDGKFIEVQDE